MKAIILALGLCGVFLVAAAPPAPPISVLAITGCGCEGGNVKCTYTQRGYGNVRETWSSGSVSCTSTPIQNRRRIIIGWNYECTMGSRSGIFEVEHIGGNGICGRDFDRISVNNCYPGTACSQLGRNW